MDKKGEIGLGLYFKQCFQDRLAPLHKEIGVVYKKVNRINWSDWDIDDTLAMWDHLNNVIIKAVERTNEG